ncbi:DUF6913 domain-containing protein [Flavobacterium rhizosphaerae]|uniref:Uncharacterized protein n=1 Tax=Flavobacterium rhizosphaerae TaxID=3163298 RepID=A0ABW8YXM8_9FLAO
MFLRFIKDFGLKKNIKKRLYNYQAAAATGKIKKVGIIVPEVHNGQLIQRLTGRGIKGEDITSLCFIKRKNKQENAKGIFSYTDITAGGDFTGQEVSSFIKQPFDLLISYYNNGELPLVAASVQSEAGFKVGLSGADIRINSLIIDSVAGNYDEFITELFKYLNTLNKL